MIFSMILTSFGMKQGKFLNTLGQINFILPLIILMSLLCCCCHFEEISAADLEKNLIQMSWRKKTSCIVSVK